MRSEKCDTKFTIHKAKCKFRRHLLLASSCRVSVSSDNNPCADDARIRPNGIAIAIQLKPRNYAWSDSLEFFVNAPPRPRRQVERQKLVSDVFQFFLCWKISEFWIETRNPTQSEHGRVCAAHPISADCRLNNNVIHEAFCQNWK